jgi:hypothetical protein
MRRRTLLGTLGSGLLAGCTDATTASLQTSVPGSGSTATPTDPTPRGRSAVAEQTPPAERGRPLLGVSLSPRSYESADFAAFLTLSSDANLAVRWVGDWAELGATDGAPTTVAKLSEARSFLPVFDTGVYSVSDRALLRPLDDDAAERYVADAVTFAERHRPAYLGLGVEVNIHATEEPTEFERFVSLFDAAYDAVKAVSPTTQVYTSFQLEWFLGLRGGLFGGENDPSTAQGSFSTGSRRRTSSASPPTRASSTATRRTSPTTTTARSPRTPRSRWPSSRPGGRPCSTSRGGGAPKPNRRGSSAVCSTSSPTST